MPDTSITFNVDETLKSRFFAAAKRDDRTGAEVLRDFMHAFVQQHPSSLDYDAWFRAAVQTGLDSANAGRLVPAEEVEATFAARRAETRRNLAPSQ